jgi:hypothetical protein
MVGEREVDPHTGVHQDELDARSAGAHERRAHAANKPDDLNRRGDRLPRDDTQHHGDRAVDPELHQDNALVNRGYSASLEHSAPTPAAVADQDVAEDDHRGVHPVHRAGIAVDLLVARRRELDRRHRAEQARSRQATHSQRDDHRSDHTATTTSTATGGRAIDGRGLGR